MSEPREQRFEGIYEKPDSEAAKAQKAKGRADAIELIKTSDDFVLFFVKKEVRDGKEGKTSGCISGVHVHNVPYIIDVIAEYTNTLKKQVMDSLFNKFKDFLNDSDSKD